MERCRINGSTQSAFTAPANRTFGNAGRDIAVGTQLYQLDMGLARQFSITEHASLQFRWEVFNVFNCAQYGQFAGDVTVASQFAVITSTINTTPVGTGTPRQIQFMLRADLSGWPYRGRPRHTRRLAI